MIPGGGPDTLGMERVETLPQPSASSANVDSGWYFRLQRVFSALLRVDPADPSYD